MEDISGGMELVEKTDGRQRTEFRFQIWNTEDSGQKTEDG